MFWLILKVLLQILAFTLALLIGALDYWWHDKRTRRFKRARLAFVTVAVAFLLGSIAATIFDDLSNTRREEGLRRELTKVQDQNDGLQKAIEVLSNKSSDILKEQRDSFVSLLEDQRKIGLDTTGKIQGAADLLQSRIKETIAQQKTTLDSITGGESFCYVRLMLGKDTAQIVVVPQGRSPQYGVHFRMWEPKNYSNIAVADFNKMRKLDYERVLGDLSSDSVVVLEPLIQLAGATEKEFSVEIGARNGFVLEHIKLLNIEGVWKAAYKVTKLRGNKSVVLFKEIDPALKDLIQW